MENQCGYVPVSYFNQSGCLFSNYFIDSLLQFAERCGVPQLPECFSSLHELLTFLLVEDLETLTETSFPTLTAKYPKLQPCDAVSVLEKYKDASVTVSSRIWKATISRNDASEIRTASTTAARYIPKLNKKTVERALKQLRSFK